LPCTGLSELSMSRMTRLRAVLATARFTHSTLSLARPLRLSSCVSNSVSNLPHLAGAGNFPVRAFPAHDNSHGRVLGKAVGIIGVIVSSEPTEDRLSQQSDELVADVFTRSTLFEEVVGRVGQAQSVIKFSACQQSCVPSDGSAPENPGELSGQS